MPRLTAAEIDRFIAEHFPSVEGFAKIEHLGDDELRVRAPFHPRYLRPGGRISGPTLMTLADTAVYFLVLANLRAIRDTFTSSLEIHFLRPAPPRDLLADARLLKIGRRLAIGTVDIRSDGDPAIVAHATVTYAVPQDSP